LLTSALSLRPIGFASDREWGVESPIGPKGSPLLSDASFFPPTPHGPLPAPAPNSPSIAFDTPLTLISMATAPRTPWRSAPREPATCRAPWRSLSPLPHCCGPPMVVTPRCPPGAVTDMAVAVSGDGCFLFLLHLLAATWRWRTPDGEGGARAGALTWGFFCPSPAAPPFSPNTATEVTAVVDGAGLGCGGAAEALGWPATADSAVAPIPPPRGGRWRRPADLVARRRRRVGHADRRAVRRLAGPRLGAVAPPLRRWGGGAVDPRLATAAAAARYHKEAARPPRVRRYGRRRRARRPAPRRRRGRRL